MKILELRSSNIKKIKAVELTIDDKQNVVLLTGKNGQGKSSILDSIWYALGGKKAAPEKPIRDGEESAEIEINLDGYIVTRTFTEKGSYLKALNKDGAKFSNPQEFLDYILGNLSFDPLEFSRMDAKKQIQQLITICGEDFSDIDAKKKTLLEERTFVYREQQKLPKHELEVLEQANAVAIHPEESISELSDLLQKANAQNNEYRSAQAQIIANTQEINRIDKQIAELMSAIERLKASSSQLEAVKDTEINVDEIKLRITNAEEKNRQISKAKAILAEDEAVRKKKNEYNVLSRKISDIEEEKKMRLSKINMPLEGLSWNEDCVLYNDIPFNQISSAEQLKVSLSIAMASNPKLKVILIKDGSLLDSENMKVISEMAKEKDFQIWIERADESGKMGIFIEDGMIKTINENVS